MENIDYGKSKALDILKDYYPALYDFIKDDPKTPQFYKDIYTIVIHRWPWAKKILVAT